MDLIKIGRYIADKRKGLGLTQRQLAEKLGMSDKSVSKWERGVCLPDVSVYSDLCLLLGISIHEFLAGEDIPQESIIQKAEENIIVVTTDSKQKQHKLKMMILVLLVAALFIFSVIGIVIYQKMKPRNFIGPVGQDSIEMETAKLYAGPEGAHIYRFTTTDAYQTLRIYVSEYQDGKLINKQDMELGFWDIGSPESGAILIFPDFDNYAVKLVVSAEGAKYSTEFDILENVADRAYYGRSSTGIAENTTIHYGAEQALLALIYDNDVMSVPPIYNLIDNQLGILENNDYVYYFSFEFCK